MLSKIKYLTAGESHGKGLLGIIDGIPAGLNIDEEYIKKELARRQKGYGRSARMKIEDDFAEIYTGIRHGQTLGSPIGLIIKNNDWKNWTSRMSIDKSEKSDLKVTLPRPGHADLAGINKYDFDDIRNVIERSSARETAMRVALASICRKLLDNFGIEIGSRVIQIHNVIDESLIPNNFGPKDLNSLVDKSSVRCYDKSIEEKMIKAIDKAKKEGDSVGGIFELIVKGLPYGLGSYVQWDKKLQARIAESIMSINAFKSIEIGLGSKSANCYGSKMHDEIGWDGKKYTRFSNNAGGIEGGMSNAQPIVVRVAMKPIPTLTKPLKSIDIKTKQAQTAHKERTDSCSVPSASIIGESMLCFVLADAVLEKFGGDTINQLKLHINASAKY